MKQNFRTKTVLITGATRGLGAQIAELFWQCGANLVLIARDAAKLSELEKTFLPTACPQQTITLFPADLSQPISLEKIKQIDILINNAAIQGPIGPLWENDWDKWQAALQVNLITPILLCRTVLPWMTQKHYGKIINISGGGATNARPGFSAYATAKAGLVHFSETLAAEVKPFNITVNCVSPGIMNTDMLKEIINAGEKSGAQEVLNASYALQSDNSTLKRAAELCLFLASKECDEVTGKLISALWDPWITLADYLSDIKNSDVYTLKRILPKDRGMKWGEL
jgi:NAD(P)-dependent dehydrogenase (short-subunit alcohol dehydrogenase family)